MKRDRKLSSARGNGDGFLLVVGLVVGICAIVLACIWRHP